MWPPAIAEIRLLMLTGCRKSETHTLRWGDVDRAGGKFRLRDGKRGPRMVPLTVSLHESVNHKGGLFLMFVSPKKTL